MGFRTIENGIKSGALNKAAPVLLYGEERFLVDFYERRLLALFSGQGADSADSGAETADKVLHDLDVSVFYGDEAGDEAIMGALDTFPMLSPARVVIVKNHPGFSTAGTAGAAGESAKRKNGLADYIAQMPDTARLLFTSADVNKTRALYKAAAKYGTVYEFARLDESDLKTFARKRFKALGADIAPDVLDAFVFATGYLEKDTDRDLFAVENDAYKIASFVLAEGRTGITHADLEECLPGILRTDVFAMLDAISSGRKADAVRLLENSLAGGESVFRLLSLFTGHFEIMLGYKELSAEGHSPKVITQKLGERSDWRVKKLGGFAVRFEQEKLEWILSRLYGMERDIKSGDLPERLALTVLLAEV